MTVKFGNFSRAEPAIAAAAAIVAAGVLAILGAWGFQYLLGFQPCPLCLEQRYAYYVSIPLAALLLLALNYGGSRKTILAGFAVIAAAMAWNAGLGVYHSGVEWKLWAGPTDCSGPLNDLGSAGGLMKQLQSIRVVRCDEAAWRFLGLSLAGYNVLISLALAGAALLGLRATLSRPAD